MLQLLNILAFICEIFLPKYISFKFMQFAKALLPMLVTLSGIVIVFKLEQPKKADSPIFVHSSEIVNDAKFLQL